MHYIQKNFVVDCCAVRCFLWFCRPHQCMWDASSDTSRISIFLSLVLIKQPEEYQYLQSLNVMRVAIYSKQAKNGDDYIIFAIGRGNSTHYLVECIVLYIVPSQ